MVVSCVVGCVVGCGVGERRVSDRLCGGFCCGVGVQRVSGGFCGGLGDVLWGGCAAGE